MLGLLGDEWTLLVMQQSLLGATRFGEFKSRLPISNSVLTARLRTLTDAGLLERRQYQERPARFEYLATPRGRSLWPVLLSIWEWERHWVPDHAEPLPTMRHTACGAEFIPVVACRSCGAVVSEKDVVPQWGPSGSWQRSMPSAATRRRSEADQQAAAGMFPQTMSVMGNRWGFALLVAAFVGVRRFTDFQAQLGAPPGSIADRLSIFTANGVLADAGNRYELTEKGRALFPVLITALQWAQRWFASPEGPAVLLTHTVCGHRFTAVLACDQCGRPLSGAQVSAVGNS
ncbi:winged helix-turn-helix transcriptional regulator [Mycolicibacterium sp. ND9-15]|uniref:winged helix-turn-helix transcriptional regulator n=1 Tax=Mycolicibacterium sp. ND9-15 TaxID=3042320 RepID=UPI002DD81012|nr:winged helix-turn-helix transcriptional regulator [Mycolicibacterium sp. ND9-15]WSE58850.1 winged helix-turn-helix transcriptional regulator [Mycolicibacterium sp. ND9-15]